MANQARITALIALHNERMAAIAEKREPFEAVVVICEVVLRLNPASREYWHYKEPRED